MTIQEYLAARAVDQLAGRAKLEAAVAGLAAGGTEADMLLTRAEGVKALASRQEAATFEQTVQTLAALSREVWAAHAAAIAALEALKQLADVERNLTASLS